MRKSSDAGIVIKTIKYSSSYTCNNFALLCTSSDTVGHSRMLETMTHVGSPMQQTSWLLQEMIPVPHDRLYLQSILWTWSLRRCCLLHQQVYTPVTILSRSCMVSHNASSLLNRLVIETPFNPTSTPTPKFICPVSTTFSDTSQSSGQFYY